MSGIATDHRVWQNPTIVKALVILTYNWDDILSILFPQDRPSVQSTTIRFCKTAC